ncbi:MAG: hypothetical protein Q9213_002425 [Squamulea squamosa]
MPIPSSEMPTIAIDDGTVLPTVPDLTSCGHTNQGNASHVFDKTMAPTRKRKRRQFSDSERERIKYVRKMGACQECKLKKCKCTHVPVDQPSPRTPDSDGNEPTTPTPGHMIGTELSPFADVRECSFEGLLDFDFDLV